MKRLFSSLLLLLCLYCAKSNAQVYVSSHIVVNAMPTMSHDSTTCSSTCSVNLLINVDSSFLSDTLRVIDSFSGVVLATYVNITGASPWSVSTPVPIYTSMMSDLYLSSGVAFFYGGMIKVKTMPFALNAFSLSYSYTVPDPCEYGNVTGRAYIDNNGNCTYDAGDVALNGFNITGTASLSSPSVSTFSNNTNTASPGTYSLKMQQSWMTSYNVGIPSVYAFLFPASPCFTTGYSFTTLPQSNVDFPLLCTNNVDVGVRMCMPVATRLHTPIMLRCYVANNGCDSVSDQLTLIKDHRTIYDPVLSLVPADYVSGDTLSWNYTNLTNLSGGAYWNSFLSSVYLTTDTGVAAGDTLCFQLFTGIPATDIAPYNNALNICIPVVYSYDPNIKEVSPKGTGPEGYIPATTPDLTYTIHFQNTGTAPAYEVNVIDTLDSNVDPSSLVIQGTSHNMTPEWLAPGVIKFHYNSIILTDSASDEPNSHGMVSYRVKMNTGLTPGTQVKNKAYIYFDLNPPVITNTALNTIELPITTSVATAPQVQFKVYPNPATDQLSVEGINGTLSITNVTGQTVLTANGTGKTTIDISTLAPGIYIIKAGNSSGTVTRFTKQ